jgi:hypothetical protein
MMTVPVADGRLLEAAFPAPCGSSQITRVSVTQPPLTVTDAFSPLLADSLLHPAGVRWILPSEPPALHRRSALPLAVAVDAAGAPVQSAVVGPSGELTLGGRVIGTGPIGAAFLAGADVGPTAYSRLHGLLYQVVASSANAPLDTLRVRSITGTPEDIPLVSDETLPLAARAAIFTEADRRLWVLGTGKRDGGKTSLYVIDTDIGRVEAVRHFVTELERFWLATGEDNAVALIAAPALAPWYRLVLFEPESFLTPGIPRVAGVEHRSGRPLGTLRVDGGAVLLPETGNGPLNNPNHPPVLATAVIPLSDLAGSKGGAVFIDDK